MPSSGIDRVGILGINGDRFDVLDVGMIRWRHAVPVVAAILAAKYAIQGSNDQNFGVAVKHSHGSDGLTVHPRQGIPFLAAVAAAEDVANLLAGYAPGRNIDVLWVLRIDHDVV